MTAAVVVNNLVSGYGGVRIIDRVSLAIEEGEIFAIAGKNGMGKTTLVKSLLGLLTPWGGTATILGAATSGRPNRLLGRDVTYAPQEGGTFGELTVEDNLRLGCPQLSRREFGRGRDRVTQLFPALGERLKQRAGTMSGGEQAMMKVARALLPEPRIAIFDEVSEGLQPLMVAKLEAGLASEQERGVTILMVEQNLSMITRLATRYAVLTRGAIETVASTKDPSVRAELERHLSI